jgi:REP element-mobilizing transposase RayT
MPQSLANVLVHTIFSTKDRHPFLRGPILRTELHQYLGGILSNLSCSPIIVGGTDNHVHLLNNLSRTCDISTMIKELKRGSSLWLKTKRPELSDFSWQSGYGIFSVSCSQLESVKAYIANQEAHHRKISFQDELRQFLKRHEVSFDERYVWD